ncbi:hypothetical protein [Pelagimonas varians]|uniref:Uncharacterized protein n=1 Tax=Pelagimonas varians TaxID=696760 RepID=A0A238KZQ9_9RHOB|nr:hypothetical protein [Pelagimonas varians]PYG27838.1 hypothetical protein C8N36_114114 [Pelagimonas varians]SMX47692.1 hypothetical protein PEV8663_03613 [Pelagimonas varians]
MIAARAEAERRAYDEVWDTMVVSEALKEELRGAFENGQALSQTDVGAGIWCAVTEAGALANNLGISLQLAQRIASFGPQCMAGKDTKVPLTGMQYGRRGGDPRNMDGSAYDWQNRYAEVFMRNRETLAHAKGVRARSDCSKDHGAGDRKGGSRRYSGCA